jgi:hypothetical protein
MSHYCPWLEFPGIPEPVVLVSAQAVSTRLARALIQKAIRSAALQSTQSQTVHLHGQHPWRWIVPVDPAKSVLTGSSREAQDDQPRARLHTHQTGEAINEASVLTSSPAHGT